MKHEEMTVSLRTLVQLACAENARREMAALPTPQRLKERYPDTADLTRRVLAAIEMLQKKAKKPPHRSWRTIKRGLIAAAIAASLLFGTLMTNAAVRGVVVNTILEWTNRDLGIRFEIEGEPLSSLPEGYGPHYIPDGLIYQESLSWANSGGFFYEYQSENQESHLSIEVRIAQNSSDYWMDNEHIDYDKVTFNGTAAYLGTFQQHDGYVMLWAKNGVEHFIYIESPGVTLSEVYQIAENIY